jgi:hypothetical protein
MSGKKSKENIPATTTSSNAIHPRRCMTQNFLLIWLGVSIDENKKDCQNTLAQLRNVSNDVDIFTQPDQCIDFLTDVKDIKAFLIVEDTIGQQLLPLIHDIPQLDALYILCHNKSTNEQWAKEWVKVKGVHTDIAAICESLQQDVKQCNENAVSMSFIALNEEASSQNLNQLEPTFMYTQIFKEILLTMKYDRQSIKNFTTYCRNGNCGSPNNITLFENEYHAELAIWWYTFPSFICSMLNCALRMLQAETIINMGFFLQDIHQQIEELHKSQVNDYHGNSFTLTIDSSCVGKQLHGLRYLWRETPCPFKQVTIYSGTDSNLPAPPYIRLF